MTTLEQIVSEKPFPDYADWWEMGELFIRFMSEAIVSEWRALPCNPGDFHPVQTFAEQYIRVVFGKEARGTLVGDFGKQLPRPYLSGEFDALSYAFFRSAFELMEKHVHDHTLPQARRQFTQRVGKRFFAAVHDHLQLDLPPRLETVDQLARLQENIQRVGDFFQKQGYLRDHFSFTFDVQVSHEGKQIVQTTSGFLDALKENGVAYAVYEMGYPVILPSAVYLYHTLGEAQHHSSRTIEELFDRVGYTARETDDFDPTGFPPDRVVELWEIRPLIGSGGGGKRGGRQENS